MECEKNDGQAEMGQTHRGGDGGSEEGVTHWFQHEGRGVRVERGVEQAIYAGEVEAAVLCEGVVARDGDGEEGESADQKQGEGALARRPAALDRMRAGLQFKCRYRCRQFLPLHSPEPSCMASAFHRPC